MPYDWIEGYCLGKPGTEKDYKEEWEAFRYMLRGRMYAMTGGDKDGTPIITLKLEPQHGELLRKEYPGKIVPGYYMNKQHWNSLYLESEVPDEVVRDMIDCSHALILASLPQKVQVEILGDV